MRSTTKPQTEYPLTKLHRNCIHIRLSHFFQSIKLSDAKYDFQTYEIFKTETIYRNNTDCTCTVPDSGKLSKLML